MPTFILNAIAGRFSTFTRLMLTAVAILGLTWSGVRAEEFFRVQILSVPSMTLSTEQFLTGDKNGKATMLAGELRMPGLGTEKLPAVILVPGVAGLNSNHDRWARELNSIGAAAFILDNFTGRQLFSPDDQAKLSSLTMMVDAYRALALLAEHPRIDPARIAIMGFSKGTVATLYSSAERFLKMYGPTTTQFAAHIGLYSLCYVTYQEDSNTTGKPIRLFHGIVDDANSIVPCRSYVERLKKARADVTLTEFPDAHHVYDALALQTPIKFPSLTARNCFVEERAGGQLFNSKTDRLFDVTDPCLERGYTIGYNAAAYEATLQAVKQFLREIFSLK